MKEMKLQRSLSQPVRAIHIRQLYPDLFIWTKGVLHSVKTTITIQRQMLDIVHAGGTEGVTLNVSH